jgi:3D (Asp-Asp-Asp) domain-containing protein
VTRAHCSEKLALNHRIGETRLMKSTAIGSAVSVLFIFSAISYADTYIRHQDPKPAQPASSQQAQLSGTQSATAPADQAVESARQEFKASGPAVADSASPNTLAAVKTSAATADFEVAPQTYTATAYSLRGRTASGKLVSRGLIAADPRVLPLGTRVRVEAGSFSGEYEVADTGGGVKGRRIDIWIPTSREAMKFGRRAVKLTVLSFGGRRAKAAAVRSRRVNASPEPSQVPQSKPKQ